jgi:hypothetical protein
MSDVIFISSEWTGICHPDATHEKLKILKNNLLRMLTGDMPEVAPDYASAIYLPKGAAIKSCEWKQIAKRAFIWIEYAAS